MTDVDGVAACVRDVLAEFAPLPGRGEHGAQDLKRAVGNCVFEPDGDPHMINGVEPEPPERQHQAAAHVAVVGPK